MTTARQRPAAPSSSATLSRYRATLPIPGLLLCAAIAAVATVGGEFAPIVGAPVIGIIIGVVWRLTIGLGVRLDPGVAKAKEFGLQCAVVVLGSQLSLTEVVKVGYGSLPVMLGTLISCLGVAYLVGRKLGIGSDLRTLIGVGTAICGASAIAAVSPVIKAKSNQIAYAVSTIFLYNITAVLAFPPLGHALGLSQTEFGLFAGTAVNDTSSVVAAASAYGHSAADHAVVVKLVRTLMIIPICLALAALVRRRPAEGASTEERGRSGPRWQSAEGASTEERGRSGPRWQSAEGASTEERGVNPFKLVPWFLIGFLLVAAANSVKLIPAGSHVALSHGSLFLITTALAAIGLSTNVAELRRTGMKPLLLGLILWITVTVSSLLLQWAF